MNWRPVIYPCRCSVKDPEGRYKKNKCIWQKKQEGAGRPLFTGHALLDFPVTTIPKIIILGIVAGKIIKTHYDTPCSG